MVESDLALQRVLERLSPEAEAHAAMPDWATIRDRVSVPRGGRDRQRRLAFAGVVALLAICLPTIALSASVRGWLGFGPQPVYNKARLVVSTAIPGKRIARLWISPSTDGGACEFLTITPASFVAIDPTTGTTRPPTARTRGSSECTAGGGTPLPSTALSWILSPLKPAGPHAALLHGHIGQTYKTARVDIRWHGGRTKLRLADGYFIGVAKTIWNPSFNRLPYTVVAYNSQGHTVARRRIPTSFLFTDWKSVEPRLRQYRQTHGCSKSPGQLWICKKR